MNKHEDVARVRTTRMLKDILDNYNALRICRAVDEQGKRMTSAGQSGLEWARLVSSPSFEEKVRLWGFETVEQLFSLPEEHRIVYYDQAIGFLESIFGQDAEGLQRILDEAEKCVDKRELLILKLKAEDIETEVAAAFSGIADRTKIAARGIDQRNPDKHT